MLLAQQLHKNTITILFLFGKLQVKNDSMKSLRSRFRRRRWQKSPQQRFSPQAASVPQTASLKPPQWKKVLYDCVTSMEN